MKKVLFFLLMIFVSSGAITDYEVQTRGRDCFIAFAKDTIFSAFSVLDNRTIWRWYQNEDIGEYYWQTELGTCKNNKFTSSGVRLLIRAGSLCLNGNHAIRGTLQELINTVEKTAFLGDRLKSYIRVGTYQRKGSDPVQLLTVLDNSIMAKYFKDEKPTYARMTVHLPNKNESYECLIKIQHELIRSEEKQNLFLRRQINHYEKLYNSWNRCLLCVSFTGKDHVTLLFCTK